MTFEHGVYVRALGATFEGARVFVPSFAVWRDGTWLWSKIESGLRSLTEADAIARGKAEAESFAADLPVIEVWNKPL